MSLRSHLIKLGTLAAGGALALAATAPASAADPSAEAKPRPHVYKGKVIAKGGLLLREAPTRGSSVVRSEPYGAVVHIFCKTKGQWVDKNNRWYLLTDGTWAWGAARYIKNIGPAPRTC